MFRVKFPKLYMGTPAPIRLVDVAAVIANEMSAHSDVSPSSSPPVARQTVSNVNLIRAVAQNGQGELNALDARIGKLEAELEQLREERAVVQQLVDIAKTHRPTVERLVK